MAETAVVESLSEGRMAKAETSGGVESLEEYDVATNGVSLHFQRSSCSSLWSSFSWFWMYSRIAFSSRPTVLTK